MDAAIPAFVPMPGGMELMIILGIAILLFGANKIPELARSSGQAMGEFKKGREEIEDDIRDAANQGAASVDDANTSESKETA
jgi:sec-independent protein translocase protein TatA